MKLFTQFNHDPKDRRVALSKFEKSRTQQSFKDDADINILVRRFGLDGQLPSGVRLPVYGDFTGVADFRTAHEAIEMAVDSFMQMPARVRARFENDAGKFMEFFNREENYKEARELGLLAPEPPAPVEPPPTRVIVVPPEGSQAASKAS